MAKYQVNYSCGHTGVVDLWGKEKERERLIDSWEKTGICKECYKSQVAEKINKLESEKNLPELQGTEKQIAWAKKIRYQKINEWKPGYFQAFSIFENILKENDKCKLIEKAKSVLKKLNIMTEEEVKQKNLNNIKRQLTEQIEFVEFYERFSTETSSAWFIENRDF